MQDISMTENNTLRNLSEILMATSEKKFSVERTVMIKRGTLRKIAPKVYTTNMEEAPETIIRRNLFFILGRLYPHAILSHRTAFELKPTAEGDIYLTYMYTKRVELPSITVHLMEGPTGTEYDMPFRENLYLSGTERRILENLQKCRARGGVSKCLPRVTIEEFLKQMLQENGEVGLNTFREKARGIAEELGMKDEFETLNVMIGSLLLTKPYNILSAAGTVAKAQKEVL